jgi:hypothetical protein
VSPPDLTKPTVEDVADAELAMREADPTEDPFAKGWKNVRDTFGNRLS